jgi:subtilisin family serine protease
MNNLREHFGFQAGEPTGAGVKIAVIDTGIDTKHPDLCSAYSTQLSRDLSASRFGLSDVDGHGTHVSGIIAARSAWRNGQLGGVAPDATLVVIKVGDESSSISLGRLAHAIEVAVDQGANIINLSINIFTYPHIGLRLLDWVLAPNLPSPVVWPVYPALDAAFSYAERHGVLCIVPAGNIPNGPRPGTIMPPAGQPTVLAVGAININRSLCYFSARPPYYFDPGASLPRRLTWMTTPHVNPAKPDVVALGEGIWTQHPADAYAPRPEPDVGPDGLKRHFVHVSGTSFSAAVVSGLAACALEYAWNAHIHLGPAPAATLRRALQSGAHRTIYASTSEAGYGELTWTGAWRGIDSLGRPSAAGRSNAPQSPLRVRDLSATSRSHRNAAFWRSSRIDWAENE